MASLLLKGAMSSSVVKVIVIGAGSQTPGLKHTKHVLCH